ncbi:P-loop containing nucleoside triphosphate hydrolase [Glarea lozoyensis ATCC 20868]|uniref:p-loop containing nucleoside triphosphate hydrolase n=1 Tax=Glarea lozoyensis (strain ATCC 20868 / MF5171) TaxID=1116229 RepID=S3E1D3_GLAL2|nr:P-loop containing nucleoside triphosphate hydrolase [Glarea lozoyensis ATCC 20868]EPE32278.1 P-loop containing nucleoside triphosphate hydrolase [Glarea lozoyensis ATCC 20868]
MSPIPITIITGFLGSGKTTLLLNLIPQLLSQNPSYKLALVKNEFGDVAIDSQLASSSSISGVRELLNGCICCNLVGQLDTALEELRKTVKPDRIVIETSGSAFPATLAMEVNRLARDTKAYALDGVVTVIDVENWKGYEDTSYTAKIQAKYTDLIVLNKWEIAGERRLDECLDRVGDLEVQVATVKSDKGKVPVDLVFGVDGASARLLGVEGAEKHHHDHANGHEHAKSHQSEVEVLSITLMASSPSSKINNAKLTKLLESAPKDEVYRIKSVFASASPIPAPDSESEIAESERYILNWAFGRWTCTPLKGEENVSSGGEGVILRMTMILARFESKKWKKKIETLGFIELDGDENGSLVVENIN